MGVRLERAAKKPFIYNVPGARFENRLIQKGRWTFEQKKLQNDLSGSASVELVLLLIIESDRTSRICLTRQAASARFKKE